MSTLFTKIIQGEISSYKIYEDEYVFAFLDIFPQQPGHTLIVPKGEFDHFSEVPEPYYSRIFEVAKKLSPAIKQATNCNRICASFVGYEIPHCHFHLIPTTSIDQANFHTTSRASDEDLLAMQKSILLALSA